MPQPLQVGNPTLRNKWIKNGMLDPSKASFWSPYISNSSKGNFINFFSPNMISNAESGHNMVFQAYGQLTDSAILGENQAEGKGEQKRRFRSDMSMTKARDVVDNGNLFAAIASNDAELTKHANSVKMLAQKFYNHRDQALFDLCQASMLNPHGRQTITPSHTLTVNHNDNLYDTIMGFGTMLKTGMRPGDSEWTLRTPLTPVSTNDGEPVYALICDSMVIDKFRQDTTFKDLFKNADMRGKNNRAFTGVVGKIGNVMIIEAPTFFGAYPDDQDTWTLGETQVQHPGMRQQDNTGKWSGHPDFDYSNIKSTMCFFIGANAIQLAVGKNPQYSFQMKDFGNATESCMEWWMNMQRTRWTLNENDKPYVRKMYDVDVGFINVKINHS